MVKLKEKISNLGFLGWNVFWRGSIAARRNLFGTKILESILICFLRDVLLGFW